MDNAKKEKTFQYTTNPGKTGLETKSRNPESEIGAKPEKMLVGTIGLEPTTPTMSR